MKDILKEAIDVANDTRGVSALIESSKYKPLSKTQSIMMKTLLENTQKDMRRMLTEGTLTADIAQFTPILLPMIRRMFPTLIANHLLGVQEMSMPTGYIFAFTNQYLGNGVHKVGDRPTPAGVIYEFDTNIADAITAGSVTAANFEVGATLGTGKVLHVEGNKVLASFENTKLAVGATIGGDPNASPNPIPAIRITGVYTNEAAFGKILKNFTGPYTTGDAEILGDTMNEIGFSISRKSIEVKSRKLKGRYTLEAYQDALAQHGIVADEEMMNTMQYEMSAELDREAVDFVNSNATQLPDTNFGVPASAASIIIPDGRWEIERYRAQIIRISKESQLIGIDTKRGAGNVLLVSPLVATMLEQVGTFTGAPVKSDVVSPVSGGYAGIFDNKYTVVVDQYAESDYCTVLYKGIDNRDAMGFYAPYVPLQFIRTTAYETGQPAIIAQTRYALETIPGVETPESNDRAKLYARSFGIDFTNTVLAH